MPDASANEKTTRTEPLTVSVGALSVTGNVREENQDRMSRRQVPLGDLFMVADGMGGYEGGAKAAQITVATVEKLMAGAECMSAQDALRSALEGANQEVRQSAETGDPEMKAMGSTVVALLVANDTAYIAHVGDSRAYLVREGHLQQITTDHTKVQSLINAGALSVEDARDHPDASTLTRVIGVRPQVEPDIQPPLPLQDGDGVLLCSDGLSGYVENSTIEKLIGTGSAVKEIVEQLVNRALEAGGEDNITVQYVRFGGVPAQASGKSSLHADTLAKRVSVVVATLIVLAGVALVGWRYLQPKSPVTMTAAPVAVQTPPRADDVKTPAPPPPAPADHSRTAAPDALAAEQKRAIQAEQRLQAEIDSLKDELHALKNNSPAHAHSKGAGDAPKTGSPGSPSPAPAKTSPEPPPAQPSQTDGSTNPKSL